MTDNSRIETPAQRAERTLDHTAKHLPENSPTDNGRSKSEVGTSGKGIASSTLPAGDDQLGATENQPADASGNASAALPHERDQSTDMTAEAPDPMIAQASRDVNNGLKDTSKAAETDEAYEKFR